MINQNKLFLIFLIAGAFFLFAYDKTNSSMNKPDLVYNGTSTLLASTEEPTKALDSKLSLDNISSITTSEGLSKADLAWHAINTYAFFDCIEVIKKGEMTEEGYFLITCSSGMELRTYPRNGKHPKITKK